MKLMIVVLAVLIFATPAWAGASVADLLVAGNAAAAEGNPEEAASAFGKAAALAHKTGDLAAEGDVTDALEDFFAGLQTGQAAARNDESTPAEETAAREARWQQALALVLAELDPARLGAMVSAPVIARRVLEAATDSGANDGVKEAAAVLEKSRKNKKAGAAAIALADYGKGLRARADGDNAAAATALRSSLNRVFDNGWSELTVRIGTEAAVAFLASGDAKAAQQALADVAATLDVQQILVAILWRRLVDTRLKDAPKDVLAPATAFLGDTPSRRNSAFAPGARVKGGSVAPDSVLVAALKKMKKTKAFVSVTRTDDGLLLREHFGPEREHTPTAGMMVDFWMQDGVTIGFHGHQVMLRAVDLTVRHGAPGGSPYPSAAWALYPLAPGETWGVTKVGVVTITRKR